MEFPENVFWSQSANEDLENLSNYLSNVWGQKVLTRFISKLNHLIIQITRNPKQYPFINSGLQIRKCVITRQNTLFYRVKNQKIEIIRIFDTRQDPDKLKILF